MDELAQLRSLLRSHLSGGNTDPLGLAPKIPKYDVYPRDYLQFAEEELAIGTARSKIACVANLKRAVDSQVEIFLKAYGLYDLVAAQGGGLGARLEFLERVGLFNSRALRRLNAIRNKVEHEFRVPEIQELDVYHDLAYALVSLLEKVILLPFTSHQTLFAWDDMGNQWPAKLDVEWNPTKGVLSFKADRDVGGLMCSFDGKDWAAFQAALRIHFLLSQRQAFRSDDYIVKNL
jgi:hypothetical protein